MWRERAGFGNLPEAIRAAARVEANGEVAWPISDAEAAIIALAAVDRVILGLDLRRYDDGVFEVPWSSFEPAGADHRDDVRNGREAALAALARPDTREHGDWVLITWR